MTRLGGFGFLNSFHCEKVSFLTFGALIASGYFGYIALVQQQFPQVNIFGIDMTLLFISLMFLVGGYLGVIYYRMTHRKRPIFVWKFWSTTD